MKTLIDNAYVLLPDGDGLKIERTSVAIDGSTISAIGEIPQEFSANHRINGKNRLVIPGLVNCHTHAYMSLFRNLADDLAFSDWLFGNILPREDKLTSEDAYCAAMLSCAEMIKSGTTAFLDMHMFGGMSARAAVETGLRGVMSRGLVGESADDEGGLRRIEEAKAEMSAFANESRISFMLAPHAIYTCSEDYLRLVSETAKELGTGIHIHLSETRYEVEQCIEQHGKSPVRYLYDIGMFRNKTVAAHCVHLSEEDIDILAECRVSAVHNSKSNMKLGNGFANIPALQKRGVNICIGTDSQASNNSLNLFSEMNFVSLIHKGTTENAQAVSAAEVLKFATSNGAAALGLDGSGVIEVGARADLVLLDIDCPQFCPHNNLMSALVYSANGSEVDTVLVDGCTVLENKRLTRADEEKIYFEAQRAADRIQ